MLSVRAIVKRREATGRRSVSNLTHTPFDGNNNARNKKSDCLKLGCLKMPTSLAKRKSDDQDLDVYEMKGFIKPRNKKTLTQRWAKMMNSHEEAKAAVKTFSVELLGETVTVNDVVLAGEDETEPINPESPEHRTPEDFRRTIDYFVYDNQARLTFLRAGQNLGHLLLSDELEGDKESWAEHLQQQKEAVRLWRQRCLDQHRKRELVSRKPKSSSGLWRDIGLWIRAQLQDIFPCCIPE